MLWYRKIRSLFEDKVHEHIYIHLWWIAIGHHQDLKRSWKCNTMLLILVVKIFLSYSHKDILLNFENTVFKVFNAERGMSTCQLYSLSNLFVFLKIKDLLFPCNINFYKKNLKIIYSQKDGVFRKKDAVSFLHWNKEQLKEAYFWYKQTSMRKLCKNSWQLKAVHYFRKKL